MSAAQQQRARTSHKLKQFCSVQEVRDCRFANNGGRRCCPRIRCDVCTCTGVKQLRVNNVRLENVRYDFSALVSQVCTSSSRSWLAMLSCCRCCYGTCTVSALSHGGRSVTYCVVLVLPFAASDMSIFVSRVGSRHVFPARNLNASKPWLSRGLPGCTTGPSSCLRTN